MTVDSTNDICGLCERAHLALEHDGPADLDVVRVLMNRFRMARKTEVMAQTGATPYEMAQIRADRTAEQGAVDAATRHQREMDEKIMRRALGRDPNEPPLVAPVSSTFGTSEPMARGGHARRRPLAASEATFSGGPMAYYFCCFYERKGHCRWGGTCRFSHVDGHRRRTDPSMARVYRQCERCSMRSRKYPSRHH